MNECLICGRPATAPSQVCSVECADLLRAHGYQTAGITSGAALREYADAADATRYYVGSPLTTMPKLNTIVKVSLTQATRRAQIRERMRELTFTCGWRSIVDGGTPAMKHWYLRHILLGNKRLPRVNPLSVLTYGGNPFMALLRQDRLAIR